MACFLAFFTLFHLSSTFFRTGGAFNKDISFGDIVYFEPNSIQYKKLVNGVIDQLKVSLIHRDGNEIFSNLRYQQEALRALPAW